MKKLEPLDLGTRWGGGKLSGNIISISKESDYIICDKSIIRNIIERILRLSYFSPEYQAWKPFIYTYLGSAVDNELTSKWQPVIDEKEDSLYPRTNKTSSTVASYIQMKHTSCNTIFDGVTSNDIYNLLDCAKSMIAKSKLTLQTLYDEQIFEGTMIELLNFEDKNKGLWYAFYTLVLRKQFRNLYSDKIKNLLLPFLIDWANRFKDEFIKVQNLVKGKANCYTFYCDEVKKTLFKLRESEIQYLTVGFPVDIQSIYGMSLNIDDITSKWVLNHVTHSPIYVSREYNMFTIWNILHEYYFNLRATIPDFCELLIINDVTYNNALKKIREMSNYFITTNIGLECMYYKKVALFNKGLSIKETKNELIEYFRDLWFRGFVDITQEKAYLNKIFIN